MGTSAAVVLIYAALGGGGGTILGGFPTGTAVGAVIGTLVGVLTRRDRAAREKELRRVAAQLGFQYLGDDAWRDVPRFAIFGPLPGNPGLFHFLRGERDGAKLLFCDSRMGINASTMLNRPAAILCAPDLDLPHFVTHRHLGPAGIYNLKLGVRIELPSNPKTHASGEDAAAATVFTPEVLEFLARDPEWFVEGMGNWVIALRWADTYVFRFPNQMNLLPAASVPGFLDEALTLFRLFRPQRAA